jgi:hypothetical protein
MSEQKAKQIADFDQPERELTAEQADEARGGWLFFQPTDFDAAATGGSTDNLPAPTYLKDGSLAPASSDSETSVPTFQGGVSKL